MTEKITHLNTNAQNINGAHTFIIGRISKHVTHFYKYILQMISRCSKLEWSVWKTVGV
jgi:hypothetical protein